MKRGEIYYIEPGLSEGSEQRAGRPAVIVSNNANNKNSEVVEVCYMTTKPKADLPTHVFTRSAPVPSTILCEQVHSVCVNRVGDYISELTEAERASVDLALAISLGLNFGTPENVCPADCMGTTGLTKDEVEMVKALRDAKPVFLPVEKEAEAVKTETERDLYKSFCESLLGILKRGGA